MRISDWSSDVCSSDLVRLSTYLDGGDADAFGADRIIIATGSSPRVDGVQMAIPARHMKGIEHPDAISSIDFFSGRHNSCPSCAIVVDYVGHYEVIAVAEQAGKRVGQGKRCKDRE